MDGKTLEAYVQQLLASSPGPEVEIAWQGGEPMLRGLEFFRRSVELASQHKRPDQVVRHAIQTNGTLVDEEWARFFKDNNYLVGLSLDGPRSLHDTYRIDKHGAGSFEDVLRGWNLLRKHDVDVNILCTVHAGNADHPLEVYHFFRDELGAKYIQFIPIVERATDETIEAANSGWGGAHGKDRPLYKQEGCHITERTVGADQFGAFLIAIFDKWLRTDVGRIFVTTFDVALGSWLGVHTVCVVAPTCGASLAMEHNGDVYSCDHFVEPSYRIGNIKKTPLGTLVASEKQRRFGQDKFDTLPDYCKKCPVLFACFGECPRNRFIKTPDGEDGLNYLCAGYKSFFTHIDRPMRIMARLVQSGRFAEEIMTNTDAENEALFART